MSNPIHQLKASLDAANLWQDQRVLKRNEYLTAPHAVDVNLYFVESGSIRVFVIDEEEEHTIRFGYSGSFITALDSYVTERPTELFIQALKQTEVKMVAKQQYMEFIESSRENLMLWGRILELLAYQQFERERDLLTSSPVERYQRVLARSPKLFQEVPSKYIASYLRMTSETFSRIKKS